MRHLNRKVTPRVKNGKVQRKNRATETPTIWNTPQDMPRIQRERAGPLHRHVLLKRDIEQFITVLPQWKELAVGLNAVFLAAGDDGADGWHRPGVVAICAWPRKLWIETPECYYKEHRDIFDRLMVPCVKKDREWVCQFNENQVRAYQLLHIFLHELGHHHDRMTTKSKVRSSRGEGFAEKYARENERLIWDRYLRVFPLI